MKRAIVVFAFLLVALSFNACNDQGSQPAIGLSALTDKATYSAGEQIHLSVPSKAEFDAHLPSCCSSLAFYVDKLQNGVWREHGGNGLPCEALCPGLQIVVSPGQTRHDSFSIAEGGTYRLRIPFGRGRDSQMAEVFESNTFHIQ